MLLTPVASDKDLGSYLLAIEDAGEDFTPEQNSILLRAFGCLADGLAYIYRNTIRHKDIKPQNFLVHHGQMIYTDFDIALDGNEQATTTTGIFESFTRRYCAPEVANNAPRNRKSDVFSLGCVFIEILALLVPYSRIWMRDLKPYCERVNELQSGLLDFAFTFDLRPLGKIFALCGFMIESDTLHRIDAESLPRFLWKTKFYQHHSVDPAAELFCESCREVASTASQEDF
jgi:serine/threonine protein kinase